MQLLARTVSLPEQTSPDLPADLSTDPPRLTLSLATHLDEVREVQRLRSKVFSDALGVSLPGQEPGVDRDAFDDVCEHLLVRNERTLEVVGTYRLLGPAAARRFGGYYSETEFDLASLESLRPRLAEAGRACVHPDYRSGAVIGLLWSGLAAFMLRERCEYLMGCASISLSDGGMNAAAVCESVLGRHHAPETHRVTPRVAFPRAAAPMGFDPVVPPLIKGYLRGGAWVGGEPAWDASMHVADLFMLLPLAKLERRYARHYLGRETPQ